MILRLIIVITLPFIRLNFVPNVLQKSKASSHSRKAIIWCNLKASTCSKSTPSLPVSVIARRLRERQIFKAVNIGPEPAASYEVTSVRVFLKLSPSATSVYIYICVCVCVCVCVGVTVRSERGEFTKQFDMRKREEREREKPDIRQFFYFVKLFLD